MGANDEVVVADRLEAADLDAVVARLHEGAARWARLDASARAEALRAVQRAAAAAAEAWVRAACEAKRLDPREQAAGQEWLTGPYAVVTAAARYAATFDDLARRGRTITGARFRPAPGGRLAARVLPETVHERVLFNGFTADVWMKPGVTEADVRATAGRGAKSRVPGGVCLVLGAGNIAAIGPLDVLTELVEHGRASLLKLNPTFEALLAPTRQALRPLIELGVVDVIVGDGAVGAALTRHPGIDKVHITGSKATHDRIVWGDGEEAERRRAAGTPLLDKPITSELGGVSPVIVVPGRYSRADLRYQAEHVVSMRVHNSGHNCIAAQDLIVSADWPQRVAFLAEVRDAMRRLAPRVPWYPGAAERVERIAADHPDAERVNGRLLVPVPAGEPEELKSLEAFAPVLGVTQVPGLGAAFLRNAVDFANHELFGTLGANVIVRPADRRAMGDRFDREVERLRYGTVAVNAWTGVGFLLMAATWGAYPGDTLEDVGSGIGVVHNAHLFAEPERTVVRGPFAPFPRSLAHGEASLFPKPPWFVQSRSQLAVGRRLTAYAARPGWGRIASVLVAAFRA